MRFDLLIKGGRVVDPAQGIDGSLDVALAGGSVAALAPDIPADSAYRVIDARGRLVTPGLIDLHTHVFPHFTYWGLNPDSIGPRTGVTTWVDAGSAGAITLPGFRKFIVEPATVRIKTYMNISYIGLIAPEYELRSMEYCDVDLFERVYRANSDLIVGVKVRISTPTVGDNGVEPLRSARRAAERCEIPVMVHVSDGPPEIDEVLPLLEAGDIITHCCTGGSMKLVDAEGRVRDDAKRAVDAGVILDVGHGAGGMTFASAEILIAEGIGPHVISTDLHQMSHHGAAVLSSDAADSPFIRVREGDTPKFDLDVCLGKFMALGMSLSEVIAAVTVRPAGMIGRSDLGTLAPGACGDVAVFDLEQGSFEFRDPVGEVRMGTQRLVNVATIIAGREAERRPADAPALWVDLVPAPADG